MNNPLDPNDIRAQLFASLQERMAPVAQPDTAEQEEAARKANQDAMMIRSGVQLGHAFLGQAKSDGDNLYSQSLEGDAKSQLAKAMEAKRMAAEQDKRREELRNGLSTRFVDDQNLRDRTAEDNKTKEGVAKLKREQDVADQEALFKQQTKLAGINNQGKLSAIEAKGEQKSDKPLETKIVNDKTALDNTLSLLGTIKEMKKDIPTGKASNVQNGLAQMINVDDPKVSGFKAMVGTQLADYIKSISGAAVSDQERAILLKNVPSMDDIDATFNTKLDAVIQRMTDNRGRFLQNVEGSGRKVSDQFKQTGAPQSNQPAPAGDVASKQKRLEELRAKKAAATK